LPETMPADACQFYYECPACHALLRPKPGDCCVFCSFGSAPCPTVQNKRACCKLRQGDARSDLSGR
jgi:hypothetical protein